jgi:hypothetical protein
MKPLSNDKHEAVAQALIADPKSGMARAFRVHRLVRTPADGRGWQRVSDTFQPNSSTAHSRTF